MFGCYSTRTNPCRALLGLGGTLLRRGQIREARYWLGETLLRQGKPAEVERLMLQVQQDEPRGELGGLLPRGLEIAAPRPAAVGPVQAREEGGDDLAELHQHVLGVVAHLGERVGAHSQQQRLVALARTEDSHARARGRGQQAALIYDSPVTGTQRTYTYEGLLDEVARFAGVLRGLGVGKGDRVIVYLPMIPEAAIAMLACARIGAVHSVVFGGFAAHELATRIDDAAPKVIVSASCGIEVSRVIEYKPILDRAISLARHKPEHCVILQRPQAAAALTEGGDLDWAEAAAGALPPAW